MEQSIYLVEDYVQTTLGEPYRLFPFGTIVYNGKKRTLTPEMAQRFRLPKYKPPIKLGSHDEAAPAGGHIVALEVRADGLYAVPEFNEAGQAALKEGAYRYHSPEIVWGGPLEENPVTGEIVSGPAIIGDAFLHRPHLGEAASLYSVQPIDEDQKEDQMDQVSIPVSLWDKFMAMLLPEKADEVQPEPQPAPELPEEYTAALAERDEYKAKLEAIEVEKAHAAKVENYSASLKEIGIEPAADEWTTIAEFTADEFDWVLRQLRAAKEQAKAAELFSEKGSERESDDTDLYGVIDREAKAYAEEKKCTYNQAIDALRASKPEMFKKVYK